VYVFEHFFFDPTRAPSAAATSSVTTRSTTQNLSANNEQIKPKSTNVENLKPVGNQYYDPLRAEMESENQDVPEDLLENQPELADTIIEKQQVQGNKLYQATTEVQSFAFFQNTVIPIIKAWAANDDATTHEFCNQWKLWEDKIDEDSTFEEVISHTNIFDLKEYMNQLKTYPAIQKSLFLSWDMDNSSIYWGKIVVNNIETSIEESPPNSFPV
jgi:hypothetical protein